jgi:hypothetical protein
MDCIYGSILPRIFDRYHFGSVFSRVPQPTGCSLDLEWIKSDDVYEAYAYTQFHGLDFGDKVKIILKQGKDYKASLTSWANNSSSKIWETNNPYGNCSN